MVLDALALMTTIQTIMMIMTTTTTMMMMTMKTMRKISVRSIHPPVSVTTAISRYLTLQPDRSAAMAPWSRVNANSASTITWRVCRTSSKAISSAALLTVGPSYDGVAEMAC